MLLEQAGCPWPICSLLFRCLCHVNEGSLIMTLRIHPRPQKPSSSPPYTAQNPSHSTTHCLPHASHPQFLIPSIIPQESRVLLLFSIFRLSSVSCLSSSSKYAYPPHHHRGYQPQHVVLVDVGVEMKVEIDVPSLRLGTPPLSQRVSERVVLDQISQLTSYFTDFHSISQSVSHSTARSHTRWVGQQSIRQY